MLSTLIIIVFLGAILYNLGAGLIYLIRDPDHSTRTARALTMRIGLSVALFILLMLGIATGVITPNPGPLR